MAVCVKVHILKLLRTREGIHMPLSYEPLWQLLRERKISKADLQQKCGVSKATVAKISKNLPVSPKTLEKLTSALAVPVEQIMEVTTSQPTQLSLDLDERNARVLTGLDTISLFSGAGGLDYGLIQAGFNIVFANDILKPAVENYRYNIGPISDQDITTIKASDLPSADVVVGGFPCQPFSNAGNRLGTDDDRGNLYLELIRIINAKNPKVVVMENVRGLLSMKNRDGSRLMDTIIYLLEHAASGFRVTYKLLRASDYGVPQNRYRVVIVGIRKDLGFSFHFPDPIKVDPKSLTVGQAIKIPAGTPNQNEVWALSPQSQAIVNNIPEGKSWKAVPYEKLPERLKKIRDNMQRYHSPNMYRRFARNEINGTITAAATPENSGIVHPTENRRYSVREIARIQSFPDDYIFVGDSVAAKYKVIGNAVPPKLANVIGASIVNQLREHDCLAESNSRNGYEKLSATNG